MLNHPGNSNYRKEHADAARQRPARSRLAVYRGMGHAVHWEGPRRFAGELVAFTKLVMETYGLADPSERLTSLWHDVLNSKQK